MNDRRENSRQPIGMLLPAKLVFPESGEHIPIQVFDVSPTGLGIITQGPLLPGKYVSLVALRFRIIFEVMWSEHTSAGDHFSGLRAKEGGERIKDLFDARFTQAG